MSRAPRAGTHGRAVTRRAACGRAPLFAPLALALVLCLLCAPPASANEYSPHGLYEVEHRVLANGLRVVLKPRGDARNVSMRVMVKVGILDFPCGRRETPHFLEHLLFTGTNAHDETALEALVREWGGTWNASTSYRQTVYELDIFSGRFAEGLALLHEILSDSTLTPDNVALSRDILRREAGEEPGLLRRWTYARGFGKSGVDKWMEAMGLSCATLETPDAISREDILDAYRRYYVPNNMALVIVGAFDAAQAWRVIEQGFARLPAGTPRAPAPLRLARPQAPARLENSLTRLVGADVDVLLGFTTTGYRAPDRHALYLLEHHLDTRVYEHLRVRQGLSYTPSADSLIWPDAGLLLVQANASLGETDEVIASLQEEIRDLRAHPLTEDTVRALKQEVLLVSARDYETNAEIADYYVESMHELEDDGALINEEDRLMATSAEDVRRAAATYLDLDHAVTVVERPLLSHDTLYLLLGSACVLGGLAIARRYAPRRRRLARAKAGG
jgi:predicted Zn-dependent peptidase